MDENKSGFDELAKNIKGLIDKQNQAEQEIINIGAEVGDQKEMIKALNSKAGQAQLMGNGTGVPSLHQSLANEFKAKAGDLAKLGRKEIDRLTFDIKAAPSTMTSITGGAATISNVWPNVVSPPARPFHVWDVVPQTPITNGQVAYLKETSVDGGFANTRAGSVKPQISMNLSETTAKAQVIAAWLKISAQLLDDVGYLNNYLSYRLIENLLTKLDDQLLNGDSFDPNLSGILLAANHTAKTGSATIFLEKLVEAFGQMASYNRRPSAVILNPTDFYSVMITKAATSGDYSLPTQIIGISPTGIINLLGVPVIWSSAITASNYLVGDFQTGSMLWMRNSPQVQVFYQDDTNVQQNLVTIRCEMRCAFSVFNAQAFIAAS